MRFIRTVLTIMAAAFAAARLARWLRALLRDVSRYKDIRPMSDEKPLIHEVPEMARDIAAKEATGMRDSASSLQSPPEDAARYIQMKSM